MCKSTMKCREILQCLESGHSSKGVKMSCVVAVANLLVIFISANCRMLFTTLSLKSSSREPQINVILLQLISSNLNFQVVLCGQCWVVY